MREPIKSVWSKANALAQQRLGRSLALPENCKLRVLNTEHSYNFNGDHHASRQDFR